YLNGAILGMSKAELDRKFDAIVAFSEIERFLDTPVKHYSSGMYVRLAFSVAAHVDPDILIVDEVLAVGDAGFQRKCLDAMGNVAHQQRTVLFVSHNLQAVSALTEKVMVMSEGRCVYFGPTAEGIEHYVAQYGSRASEYQNTPSSEQPRVTRVSVHTSGPNQTQHHGEPMEVHVEINTPIAIDGAFLSLQIVSSQGVPVMYVWRFDSETPMCRSPGVYRVVCRVPHTRLYMGHHTVNVYLTNRDARQRYEKLELICPFEVVMYSRPREYPYSPYAGTYIDDCEWRVEEPEADVPASVDEAVGTTASEVK
ncbi:MAG: ABC transporter ATP-binding protein, partial [Phycisphaerae bacterium]|nr:ABC transporter ATP-binding protein [Phycisphaerae bacterium]